MNPDDPDDPPGEEEREALIERAASAHRGADQLGVAPHAAWLDLDAAGRAEAYERARGDRLLEAALDAQGLSSTGRAVLAALARGRR